MWRKLLILATCVGTFGASCTSDGGITRGTSMPAGTNGPVATAGTATTGDGDPTGGSSPATTGSDEPSTPIDLSGIVAGDPDLVTGVLPNGLTYYIRRNDNPGGSAQLRLAVRAGSGRQDDDQSGVAHFLEHMLFNGTASYPENELIDVLRDSGAQFGADVNAYTSYDETVYQLMVPTEDGGQGLDTALQVLTEWLSAATIDPDEVVKERGVVLDEYRSRQESSGGRLLNGFQEIFLADSPYATRPPIGDSAAIAAMTPELLRRFYDQWYRPDNASVVVIGAIDPEDVLMRIEALFGPLLPRADAPADTPLTVSPSTRPVAAVLLDPDVTSASIELALPTVATPQSIESAAQQTADSLVFTMIANRLGDDASGADVPFDAARVDNDSFVDGLDAPSIVVDAKPGQTEAALQALLDEFERVHRYGFGDAELQRAVTGIRSQVEAWYAARDTRQDADFADGYVETFLRGQPILTAQAEYDLATIVLDAMSVDRVVRRFEERWADSSPHVVLVGPQNQAAELPTIEDIEDAIAATPDRDIDDRTPADAVSGPLMVAPEPATETSSTELTAYPDVLIDGPVRLSFANGVTVVLQDTGIADGQLVLRATSTGGMAAIAPDDVLDAHAAVAVVTSGGVGGFDQAQLNQITAGSSAAVYAFIGDSSDVMAGSAATVDLEALLQLINLYMSSPRFDQVALDNALTSIRSDGADPFADQRAAIDEALALARYGDDARFRSRLTASDADSIDLDGIERVWRSNFGNATGWTFSIAGDFERDVATELARRYLGTLAGTAPAEEPVDIVPPPPSGVVGIDITAGTGDRATLIRSYTTTVAQDVTNLVLADIATEIVSDRIRDRIREELGESYSPYAVFALTPLSTGGDAWLDVYVEITTAPDQVGVVSSVLSDEFESLVAGASESEIEAAKAVVQEQYYIYNEEIAEVLIGTVTGVGQTAADYNERYEVLFRLSDAAIDEFLAIPGGLDGYIEVGATPR